MVNNYFPDEPIQLWHAVFTAPVAQEREAYHSASLYGKQLIDFNLCKNYIIVNRIIDGITEVHCVPAIPDTNINSQTIHCWKKIQGTY